MRICELSYKFLLDHLPNEISEERLQEYFVGDNNDYNSLKDIFERIIMSAQNYQSMPNIIGYSNGKNKEAIKEIIFNLDFSKIIENYNVDSLFAAFKERFNFKISDKSNKKMNSWYKFSRSIISAAKFVNQFNDIDDFNRFVNCFSYNDLTKVSLPMLMEHELSGLGFALCCDFLKELGFHDYCKPDIHMIDVFSGCGLCEANPYEVFKCIVRCAREENYTPYKLDKIVWLICSGKYYKDDIVIKSYKEEFIEYLKNILD